MITILICIRNKEGMLAERMQRLRHSTAQLRNGIQAIKTAPASGECQL